MFSETQAGFYLIVLRGDEKSTQSFIIQSSGTITFTVVLLFLYVGVFASISVIYRDCLILSFYLRLHVVGDVGFSTVLYGCHSFY